ncbi:tyrosine-type recombinase/integrase [Ferviditalea candida]|uniref:Tyrosine-type recombinase/integrase n=1 Tax=Ferviditalea candida TaxID=3108399 RepID=A0ABU5ZJX9_9BACL|nr:tyrosine-type recombinase/integrase [Paenibacillaceae bacterium T2]
MEINNSRRKNQLDSTTLILFMKYRPTFDDLLYAFLLDCKHRNLSRRTIEYFEYCLQHMNKSFLEQNQTFDPLTASLHDIQTYFVAAMMDKGLAPHTINGRLKSCKAFFSFLRKHDYVQINVAEQLTLVKARKDTIHTFTNEQILQLLRIPHQKTFTGLRDYTIMIILLETGIRIGELLAMTLKDVHLKERELRIASGKGTKARNVPFQKTCAKVLQSNIDERGAAKTETLFISLENEPLHIRTIQDRITNYGKMARIAGVRVSPHTFRHTMAKMYSRNGGDPFSLQQILDHSSLEMVYTYVRLFSNEVREQRQRYSPVEHMKLEQT